MGAGKSTIGLQLAERLDRRFVDLDAEIERHAGLSIDRLFAKRGEAHFRKLETEEISRLLRQIGGSGGASQSSS